MRKKYFLFVHFISLIAFSQAPNIQWQKTLGGTSIDILKSVYEKNGDFYIAGFSNSPISGDKLGVNGFDDTNDIWALSLNSSGAIIWQNSYLHSNPNNLLQDNLASLRYFDNNFFFGVTYDDFDVWMSFIHKFNENGIFQNIVFPGEEDNCSGINYATYYDVITTDYFKTTDGGYLFSGTNGGLFMTCDGFSNYFISKSSSTNYNSVIWNNAFSASNYEELKATIETNDGGFLLVGMSNSNSSGDKTEDTNGGFDYWIIKVNSFGNIIWQNTIGGNLNDEPKSVVQTIDGGYLIFGNSNSNSTGDKTQNSKGGADFWLVKIDPNGAVIWNKTIGGNLDDTASKIISTNDGNYLLLGSSKSNISGDKTEANRGEFDIWIVKVNPSGTILWDKTIGGNLDDKAYDIIQTSDSGFLLATTSSSSISNEKTENSRGNKDYWVLKLEPESLSTQENNSFSNIQIYPNPTNGILNINFGGFHEAVSVTLTNVLGQLISEQHFSQISEKKIQLNEPNGIYFLEIKNEKNQERVFRILKQ